MLAKIDSCSVVGIDGFIVEVEVDISYGLPVFNIVGMPEASVRESKYRVKTAIKNSGYIFPMERLVTILPKLTFDQAIEVTRIHSVLGKIEAQTPYSTTRPFRFPHHTISDAELVGGNSTPVLGGISLSQKF